MFRWRFSGMPATSRFGQNVVRSVATLALSLILVGCERFPEDADGTLARIQSEQVIRIGLVAPLVRSRMDSRAKALIERVSAAAAAPVMLSEGYQEALFDQLERGDLDLVIGRFEKKSPWAKLVTLGPPLLREKQGKTEFHLAAGMRNGENAWISLVERESRNLAPDAQ